MTEDPTCLIDLARAVEARLTHGDRAARYLVDQVAALRCGDEHRAATADRALRIIVACGNSETAR